MGEARRVKMHRKGRLMIGNCNIIEGLFRDLPEHPWEGTWAGLKHVRPGVPEEVQHRILDFLWDFRPENEIRGRVIQFPG